MPPITSKVTDFQTIKKYMCYLQSLASECNMNYVNITLDVGAAINAFKYVWKNNFQFNNIVIHLGDFHLMKENFQVMGDLVSCSGFEDIVFQSNICSSGSLNGVLHGSHYNRAWWVHNSMSEALERLLLTRFLAEVQPSVPSILTDIAADPDAFHQSVFNLSKPMKILKWGYEKVSLGRPRSFG